jgi:integrase
MYTLNNLPKWSIHSKPDRKGLFAFFKKPWDDKQTTLRITDAADEAKANNLAPGKLVDWLNENDPSFKASFWGIGTPLSKFTDDFTRDVNAHLSENTKRIDVFNIDMFIRKMALIGVTTVEALTWEHVRGFFEEQRATRANKGHDIIVQSLRKWGEYLNKKTSFKNLFMEVAKLGNYGNRTTIWYNHEWEPYYKACSNEDKDMVSVFWHTGMYPADYYWMRKKHIVAMEGDWGINKLREKAVSQKAVINFPLKYCPARDIFMKAFNAAKNPEDRLFAIGYGETEKDYDKWHHNVNQRSRRLWERLFPGVDNKWFQDMRHTFATECASGARFGVMIPEWVLEKWMGWVPGSAMGRKFYINWNAMPELMKPQLQTASGSLLVEPKTNFHDRLPFT